jgi:hypothetical protein
MIREKQSFQMKKWSGKPIDNKKDFSLEKPRIIRRMIYAVTTTFSYRNCRPNEAAQIVPLPYFALTFPSC